MTPTLSALTPVRVALVDGGIDGGIVDLRALLDQSPLVHIVGGSPADVVVLTWEPERDLGAAIAAARRVGGDAAIVVVVPAAVPEHVVHAIRLGAEDCIPRAACDLQNGVRVLLVAAERHRATSSLRAAAYTDELTGLYNRRGYVTRAAALLKVADPKAVWQIFFDVDELKIVNDTYGHWAGDRALMEVAAVLRQAFRSTDIVARVGGDEFAVLAIAPADAVPESWTARWREPLATLATRRDLPLSVSVGLAQPDERGRMTPDDLLTRADTTMYAAKRLRKQLAHSPAARAAAALVGGR